MAVRIGDVTIRIGASTNQLEYSLKRAEKSLRASAEQFKTIGASLTLGITAPVLAAGAASFKMASDYEESLNKVRVAFGESAGSVEEFAKTTIDSIGLAEGSALEMASLFGDMATSMGLTRPAAAEMSKSLVSLAGDLASFKNIDIKEAQTALAGVFTGETESLKRLGVVMTETNVQAYALTQGITKKLQAMTQAEKTSLRYAYVMSVTKNAQGDFARTAGGAANQMRTFQESLKQLGSQIGSVLLPIITPLIKAAVTLVRNFASLDAAVKKTIITVAGLAAAIGPLIYVWGILKNAYASVIVEILRTVNVLVLQQGATAAATISTVSFGTALKAVLITAAPYVAAIAAIGAGIYYLYQTYDKAEEKALDFAEIQKQITNESNKQKAQGDALIQTVTNQKKSYEQRTKALTELQKIAPQYFAALSIEKSSIDEIKVSYDKWTASINENAKAKVSGKSLKDLISEREELTKQINVLQQKKKAQEDAKIAVGGAGVGGYSTITVTKALDDQINALVNNRLQVIRNIAELTVFQKKTEETKITVQDFVNTVKDGDKEARFTRIIKPLETTKKGVSDLIPLFQGLAKDAEKANVKKLEQSIKVANPQLSVTAQFLKTVGAEIEAIQVRADRGFITQAEADIEKAGRIKAAIQDATQQGLGTGVADALQAEFDKLNLNSLATKLEEKLNEVVNFVGPLFNQLGATFGAIFSAREASIDQYYEKEKARIEGSLMTEENKAAAIQKLDEQTQKKKAAIARKQAIIDKANAIFGATIEGARAIISGIKYGPIYAGVVGALVAAQIAAIAATPLPSLAIGTDMVKSDGMAMIHRGEAIIPANVVKGGYTGGGQELYGRLSGLDIVVSNRNAQKYLNRIG